MTKLGLEKKSGLSRYPDNRGPDNRGSTVIILINYGTIAPPDSLCFAILGGQIVNSN